MYLYVHIWSLKAPKFNNLGAFFIFYVFIWIYIVQPYLYHHVYHGLIIELVIQGMMHATERYKETTTQ